MKRAFFSIILLIAFVLNVYANMDSTKVKIDVVDITHTGLINAIKKNVLSDSICEKHKYTGNIIIARQYGHLYSYAYVGLFAKMNVKKRDINTQNNSVFTIIDNYPFFLNVIDGDPHKYYISKKKNYEITYYSYTDKKLVNNKIWIFLLLSDVEVLLMDTLSLNTEEKQSGQLPGEVVYGDAFDFRDGADEDVEYEYDANGNMTVDLNRGIKEITYDVNNRPVSVTFSTRPAEQRTKYLYDASGRKLRTTYQTSRYASLGPDDLWHVDTLELNPGIWDHIDMGGLRPLSSPGIGGAVERWDDGKVLPAEEALWSTSYVRDYCGDIIYKDGEIERILTDNGYAVPDSAGGYDYYYYVKDWQGNVRAVIDEANRRMELNSYYPYGMPMSSTASVQPYKYGGKELDRTNGLDMYDFHARQYDPIVPRFTTIDPMAEKYPSISPYAYCAGNPILYKDPDGKEKLMAFDPYDSRSKILIPGTYAYPDNNAINVFAHGANDKMSLFLKNPTDGTNYRQVIISTGEEFKSFVEKQLEIRGKSDYEINTIILHSCETGSGDNSIAEQISETYKDVKVIAPDGKLQMNKKGEHSVISNKENSQSGNWIIFENGKAVGAYSNDWQPKDKPTLWDELTKKKQ